MQIYSFIRRFFIFNIFILAGFNSFAQNVSNVLAEIRDEVITVHYIISKTKFDQNLDVSLFVSNDNGKTFIGPLREVSGDIGRIKENGIYSIKWNFVKEMAFINAELIFDVRVKIIELPIKRSYFIAYSGNAITALGLKAGMIGKTGFYLESRMSILNVNTDYYTFENGAIKDYDKLAYYKFTDFGGYSAFYAGGGINYQLREKLFWSFGLGYYIENYLYKINEYYYNSQDQTTSYVKDVDYSYEGVGIDMGFLLRYNKFIINLAGTSYGFENISSVDEIKFYWTAGIGMSF